MINRRWWMTEEIQRKREAENWQGWKDHSAALGDHLSNTFAEAMRSAVSDFTTYYPDNYVTRNPIKRKRLTTGPY